MLRTSPPDFDTRSIVVSPRQYMYSASIAKGPLTPATSTVEGAADPCPGASRAEERPAATDGTRVTGRDDGVALVGRSSVALGVRLAHPLEATARMRSEVISSRRRITLSPTEPRAQLAYRALT